MQFLNTGIAFCVLICKSIGGEMEERKVWVIGHKNPDTDSICAAITYSYLKNKV